MVSHYYKFSIILIVLIATALAGIADESGVAKSSPPAPSISKEKLLAIQKEIDSLRIEAQRLAAEERSILTLLDQLNLQTQMNTHQIELLELKQAGTEEEINRLQGRYGKLQSDLAAQKAYLVRRLQEAYKNGEMNYLRLLLQVNASADLLRSYQYISFLAKDDGKRIRRYKNSLEELEQTRIRLEQENRNLVRLRQDTHDAHGALLRAKQEKQRLLAAVQQQKEMHQNALSELNIAAMRLERLFHNQTPLRDSLLSILRFKGSLDWPVAGRIVRYFGTSTHPKFGTTLINNGIEISAPEGTSVTAVFQGTVVFAEWFKGYGKSVIISHSSGIYSLYAHNSELLVQRGDTVQRGQVIARVGSTGALYGSSLYFEIREKDQPINPLLWLRRRG